MKFMLISLLLLAGCHATTGQLVKIDEALLKDCPSTLPMLTDTSDAALLQREAMIVEQYSKCAREKNALNRVIKKLKEE